MLEIAIPDKNLSKSSTRDLVFAILSENMPRTLTEVHRELKRRFSISVSFQSVLKAVRSLQQSGAIGQNGRFYSLKKEWIFECKKFFDRIYVENFNVKKPISMNESGGVTVFTVTNLIELDTLWNDILLGWASGEKNDMRYVWKGSHCWWLVPRLQEEDILQDFFIKQKVKTYNLITEKTSLDKWAYRYYSEKKVYVNFSKKAEKNGVNVAAFGENYMKFEIPKQINDRLERIYEKSKGIGDVDLKAVMDVFKMNGKIEVVLLKDKALAGRLKDELVPLIRRG